MSLSNLINGVGWVFSFLATMYGIILASLEQDWFRNSAFCKLASTQANTFIVVIFFGIIATVAFILSNSIAGSDNERNFEGLKTEVRNEFRQVSPPTDLNKIKRMIDERGMNYDEFIRKLSRGTASDQGLKLLFEGDYDGALKKFQSEVEQIGEEKKEDIWLNIGNAYFFNEDYSSAASAYENATKSKDNSKDAWVNWGASLFKLELYDEAIEKFEYVYSMDNSDDSNLANWGAALCKKKDYIDGIYKFKMALEINPNSCETFFNLGLALGKIGEYDKAIEKYQSAVDLCPQHEDAWSNMGWCYEKIGEYKNAIEKFEKAIEMRPENAVTWSNLGMALANSGECDKSFECFEKATSINKLLGPAWTKWGWALSNCNRPDDAIEKYWYAVRINPKQRGAWINLCSLISEYKEPEAIEDAYKKANKNIPNTPELLLNWGIHFLLKGDFTGSIEKWEKALEIDPNNAPALSNISLALAATGRPQEALKKIENAVQLDPTNAEYLINYGKTLISLGEEELAKEKFEDAKRLGGRLSELDDDENTLRLYLKKILIEDSDFKAYEQKDDGKSSANKYRDVVDVDTNITNRPYLVFKPLKNDGGYYIAVEKSDISASYTVGFGLKNNGMVAAKNIRFPNNVRVRSKAKIGAVYNLTPIITLVPNDEIKLRVSFEVNYDKQEELISDLNHISSNDFDGLNFGCTIVYENEIDSFKRYALSVLYIIKMNGVIMLKSKEQPI